MSKIKKILKPVAMGQINKEELILPYVHYPDHYGTFIAFSKEKKDFPSLCFCTYPAIENYFKLKLNHESSKNSNPLRMAPLNLLYFPFTLSSFSTSSKFNGIDSLKFDKGICHRCSLSIPSLKYCHEMYGTEFVQTFGWYFKQTYLKLGIDINSLNYLEDICPNELKDKIVEYKLINKMYQEENKRINSLVFGPDRNDISKDEVTYMHNIKLNEADNYIQLKRESSKKSREISKFIENIVRQEFGVKKVGEAWVSETIVKQIIEKIFDGYSIKFHYRPKWMEGLEIDIYIEQKKIAVEYQGQQHYYPVKIWGGEKALEMTKKRDKKKLILCKKLGIKLVYIRYDDPLTEEFVKNKCLEVN